MGYYTQMRGGFKIEPPLTHKELRGTDQKFQSRNELVFLEVIDDEIETEDGIIHSKSADRVAVYEDEGKCYTIDEDLRELVEAFPGHKFTGCIEGEGEESDDVWRLYVRDGKIIKHTVEALWPDPPADD